MDHEMEELPSENQSQEANDTSIEISEDSTNTVVEKKDYSTLTITQLVDEFQTLIRDSDPNQVKNDVQAIREQFKLKIEKERSEKETEFIASGGEKDSFSFNNPYYHQFNTLSGDFKAKLHTYYKNIESQQKENLKERLAIIEELKTLYLDQNPDHQHTFKQFRNLRDRWDKAGFVPKNDVANVFKTYYHHLDNYYEYITLNKGLEELEHKNNLELKNHLIDRAKELHNETNLQKAFNELQFLHKKWKEIGPVDRDIREAKWQEFKGVTKVIHDRKHELNEHYKVEQEENLKIKREIIQLIHQLTAEEITSHQKWQQKIKLLEESRATFMKIGRVPKESNDIVWDEFKQATRDFNHKKNHYYKSLKTDQQKNLDLKNALLDRAKEIQNSTDWEATTKELIDIQAKWKKIGHVPRKNSDQIWKEFKAVCNNFFDRYHALANEKEQAFVENHTNKVAFIEKIKNEVLPTKLDDAVKQINAYSEEWKKLGKVPKNKMNVNKTFEKTIQGLLKTLNLSKGKLEDIKLDTLISQIIADEDQYRLNDEIDLTRNKIKDLEREITHLETNLSFFSSASSDNPLLNNAKENIARHKEDHLIWSKRYSRLVKVHFEKLND